jgi:hypothetical protein
MAAGLEERGESHGPAAEEVMMEPTYIAPHCAQDPIEDEWIDDYLLTRVGIIPTPEVREAFRAGRAFRARGEERRSDAAEEPLVS